MMVGQILQEEQSSDQAAGAGRDESRFWHRSTPKAVLGGGDPREGGTAWSAWIGHLADRPNSVAIETRLPGSSWPLQWCLPDDAESLGTAAMIEQLATLRKAKTKTAARLWESLEPWWAETSNSPPSACFGLECLAIAHRLPLFAARAPFSTWWELLSALIGWSREAASLSIEDDPLTAQLLGGELPLTLAHQFPEIRPCRRLARDARQRLATALCDLHDGEGLPRGEHLPMLRSLLASWTRCRAIDGKKCFSKDAANQYEWLVRSAVRFSRRDGSLTLSSKSAGAWCPDLFQAALRFGGNRDDRNVAAQALPPLGRRDASNSKLIALPEAATNSEWSAIAMLRPHWSRRSPRLAVVYDGEQMAIELESPGGLALSGSWSFEAEVDALSLVPAGKWEELCWVSDDDVDYLELEMPLSPSGKLQRQMLLARNDGFLWLNEVLLTSSPAEIQFRSLWPLAAGVRLESAEETCEGELIGKKWLATLMPLALSEWRSDSRRGKLRERDGCLELSQTIQGAGLSCPLFVDLDPRRRRKSLTWRQLTIAERREIVPADQAVGFRVERGREQWLFYRSLNPPANRSVLGHNLTAEFLAARFERTGDVDELIEIE